MASPLKTYTCYTQCQRCGVYDRDPVWCDLCGKPKDADAHVNSAGVMATGAAESAANGAASAVPTTAVGATTVEAHKGSTAAATSRTATRKKHGRNVGSRTKRPRPRSAPQTRKRKKNATANVQKAAAAKTKARTLKGKAFRKQAPARKRVAKPTRRRIVRATTTRKATPVKKVGASRKRAVRLEPPEGG